MSAETRARRYLLGQATDEESSALESEYFADDGGLDQVAVAEDALIEDYLAGALPAEERECFERHYLASPEHRARLEIVRRLTGGSSHRWYASTAFLATAAALILAVGAAVWLTIPGPASRVVTVSRPVVPAAPIAPPPRILAVTLAPYTMRGGAAPSPVVIPSDVDVVSLQPPQGTFVSGDTDADVRIQTVSGAEVWRGRVTLTSNPSGDVLAHADVPTARLSSDDYIVVVTIGGTGSQGRQESYSLRIRKART